MNAQRTAVTTFYVVGYQSRTNNMMEMAGMGVIPSLWDKTLSDATLSTLQSRIGDSYYAVYSDFESDEHGEFFVTTGVRVDKPIAPAEGLVCCHVPALEYLKITTALGPRPQILIEAWKNIWLMPPSKMGGERAFHTDFEVYDERASDSAHSQIDIFLSVK